MSDETKKDEAVTKDTEAVKAEAAKAAGKAKAEADKAEAAEAAKAAGKAKAEADRAGIADKAEAKTEAKAEAKTEAKTEAKREPAKEAEAKPVPEPAPEPEAQAKPAPVLKLTEPPKGNIIATAWLVILLSVIFGASLSGIEIWLSPIIEQNKLNEALAQIPNLVKGSVKGAKDEKTIPGRRIFRAFDSNGKLVGWVVTGKGQGFADAVEVLIGLDRQAQKLTGIFVLDQKETPGLGNYIVDPPFTDQFRGLKIGGAQLLKASQAPAQLAKGQIKAVTGATISSQTVCNIINKTVAEVAPKLASAAQGG